MQRSTTISRSAVAPAGTRLRAGRSAVAPRAAGLVARALPSVGKGSVQGTVRKQNEDRYAFTIGDEVTDDGDPYLYAAVFDGHGGYACADWLSENFTPYLEKYWDSANPELALAQAFLAADTRVLQPKRGFLGAMGERGIGGSKCGATGAVIVAFQKGGQRYLVTANCGDARIIMAKDGQAIQLTEDHVPDNEEERNRIEYFNPNKRLPLVRYVGGTWRVGGLLALSRAFGDAYMKGSAQFEGVRDGSDGYSSGFGVIAEPFTTLTPLDATCTHVLVCSDGLFANEERGGGSGLTNQELVDVMVANTGDLNKMVAGMCDAAQKAGSTDDVTGVCVKL